MHIKGMPKTFDFGFGEVVEISYLERIFDISHRSALKYLKVLRIKPFYVGKEVFFSLITFNRLLFVLSKPGADGFAFPGSKKKGQRRQGKTLDVPTEVSDEVLVQAGRPETLTEMAGASGNNPDILKKFITSPVGRPAKEKK